jgi:hypothetical protein
LIRPSVSLTLTGSAQQPSHRRVLCSPALRLTFGLLRFTRFSFHRTVRKYGIYGMIMRSGSLVAAILAAWACGPQSLAEQYLAEMKEIGNTGSTVLHVEETESYALVVGGTTSDDAVKVTPYERSGSGWDRSMMGGTSCQGPSAMLGFQAGYVYCGLLQSDDPYTGVSVAGNQATLVDLPSGDRIWFVYSKEQGDPERTN